MDRVEMLAQLNDEYATFLEALEGLSDDILLKSGALGVWSIKDIVAHMIFWNRFPLDEIAHVQRGERLTLHGSDDEINARVVAQYSIIPFDDVMRAFERSHLDVLQQISALHDADFAPDSPLAHALGASIEDTFSNNTWEHYALHAADIRAWRAQTERAAS